MTQRKQTYKQLRNTFKNVVPNLEKNFKNVSNFETIFQLWKKIKNVPNFEQSTIYGTKLKKCFIFGKMWNKIPNL